MPFETKWEDRGFFARFWGSVPVWEIDAMNQEFSDDTRCDRALYQIFDGSEVDEFVLTEFDIKKIASNDIGLEFYLKNLSIALIGSKPETIDAYQAYIETCQRINKSWTFRIFESLEEAREWLAPMVKQA